MFTYNFVSNLYLVCEWVLAYVKPKVYMELAVMKAFIEITVI